MATAIAITKSEVVGVTLTLALEEARALREYLEVQSNPASFRLNNPGLYDIEDVFSLGSAQA